MLWLSNLMVKMNNLSVLLKIQINNLCMIWIFEWLRNRLRFDFHRFHSGLMKIPIQVEKLNFHEILILNFSRYSSVLVTQYQLAKMVMEEVLPVQVRLFMTKVWTDTGL